MTLKIIFTFSTNIQMCILAIEYCNRKQRNMRLNSLYLLIIFFILIGCESQENETRYYPSQKSNDEIIKLDLDTTSLDFKEIKKLVTKNILIGKSVLVEIKDGPIIKKISKNLY
jgi:hypothetical protein